MQQIGPAPAALVSGGDIAFGLFKGPVRSVNIAQSRPYRGAGRLRLKQWIGFTVDHPHWRFCVFVLEAAGVTAATAYALHRASGRQVKRVRALPAAAAPLARSILDGTTEFRAPDLRINMRHCAGRGFHAISVFAPHAPGSPGLRIDLTLDQNPESVSLLAASLPLDRGRTMFTHKAPMAARGAARAAGQPVTFDPVRDTAIMDEHRSFLHGPIRWTWCTCAGFTREGRIAGVNLGDHPAIADQQQWNENCMWLGAALEPLGPAVFSHAPEHPARPWLMGDAHGRARLAFFPDGRLTARHALGNARMDYCQMSGRFRGTIAAQSGEIVPVSDFFGVAETMNAHF